MAPGRFFCAPGRLPGSPNHHRERGRSSHVSMVDELAVAVMPDGGRDQPTADLARLAGLTRLGARLQEAGDEAAIMRALDLGLLELRLAGLAGRLGPDGQSLQI